MNRFFDVFNRLLLKSPNIDDIRGKNDRYLKWNLSFFPIEKNKRILDLGCGPGMYFYEFMTYIPSLYVATDFDSGHIDAMNSLFNGFPNCSAIKLDLTNTQAVSALKKYSFDYVVCFDVLEHIKDDALALRNIHDIMKRCDARELFLRVPALNYIYGSNDKTIGHYRRYSSRSLRALLEKCSFHLKSIHYQNLLGVIPWIVNGKVLRRSITVSVLEWGSFDYLVPVLRHIEKFISLPIGLSINCICTIK